MNFKNKFNRYYWLRKIYTSKLFQLLQIKNPELKKKIFTSIYKSNHWVQNGSSLPKEFVSVSGHGSNIGTNQHRQLVDNFTYIIEKYEINSILDMPCGDFLWIKEIVKNKDIKYLGIDIVEELIKDNNLKFKNEKNNFHFFDIINFNTNEKFDLVLIRDLFLHIKNSDIIKIINMHPSNNAAQPTFQVDTGTNTNYNTTIAAATHFVTSQNEGGTGGGLGYYNENTGNITSFLRIGVSTGSDNDQNLNATLQLFNPASTTFNKQFILRSTSNTADDHEHDFFLGGIFNTTTAITRVRFKMASGNIDAGTFKLYGIK